MKEITRLTENQKVSAEKNHDLVWQFLRENGLSEDCYDVVIFPYLDAVRHYDMYQSCRKSNFRTFAFDIMRLALNDYNREQRKTKRSAKVLSLDALKDDLLRRENTAAVGAIVHEYAKLRDVREDALLTSEQREILALLAQGDVCVESAKVIHLNTIPALDGGYRMCETARRHAA